MGTSSAVLHNTLVRSAERSLAILRRTPRKRVAGFLDREPGAFVRVRGKASMAFGIFEACNLGLGGGDSNTGPVAELFETFKHVLHFSKAAKVSSGQEDGKVIGKRGRAHLPPGKETEKGEELYRSYTSSISSAE